MCIRDRGTRGTGRPSLTPFRTRQPVRGEMHRIEDLLVSRAATEVSGERLADLRVARMLAALEQVMGGDDQPGGAEAALDRAGLEEGLLHRVQLVAVAQALDGHDVSTLGLTRRHETRADRHVVEVD